MIAKEKHIVSPKLIAYLKWLFYTTPFKDPFAEQQGGRQFYFVCQVPIRQEEWQFLTCRQRSQSELWEKQPLEDHNEEDEGACP